MKNKLNKRKGKMVFKSLVGISCVIASLVSVSANAAVVYWEPTNADVNFVYTLDPRYNLGLFDVDDFDTAQAAPLILNITDDADTIHFTAFGSNYTVNSTVTGAQTTLFDDNQFVLAMTDGTNWFEPTSWSEKALGSNIYDISFSNGQVLSIDAVPTVVPVPAAVWLFGTGLFGLAGVARRKKA